MVTPRRFSDDEEGRGVASSRDYEQMGRTLVLVEERLRTMQEASVHRDETVARIEGKVDAQQLQLNAVVTKLAVLETQHASFWKGTTVLFGALSLIAGGIGWGISQVVSIMHH